MRIVRFGVVGVSNTLVTLIVDILLTRAGVPIPIAAASGFAAGAANGYRLNRAWTFHATGVHGTSVVVRYVAIQALGAAISAGGAAALADLLAVARIAAEISALPVATAMTYMLTRHLFLTA
ncbi:MAG TPA: GtrA family protein [Baekduia sp.]|nr:GtrA family protein [Baekduia sp.]